MRRASFSVRSSFSQTRKSPSPTPVIASKSPTEYVLGKERLDSRIQNRASQQEKARHQQEDAESERPSFREVLEVRRSPHAQRGGDLERRDEQRNDPPGAETLALL